MRVAHRDQRADQRGAAPGLTGHLFEQGAHVVVVALGIAETGGVKSGIDPGLAVKRVHTQAGVVGNGWQAALAAGVARLGKRVLDKGAKRFFGFANAQFSLGDQGQAQGRKQAAQLGQLAGIIGREHVLQHFLIK